MSYSPYTTAQATFASPYSSCEASFDSPFAELDEVLAAWPALPSQDYVLPVHHEATLGHIAYTGTQLDYMSSAPSYTDSFLPWSPEFSSFSDSDMKPWNGTPSPGQCSSPPSTMCTPLLISGGLLDATYSPLFTMYSSSSDSGLESWNGTPSPGQCNSPPSAMYIDPLIGGGPLDSKYGSSSTGYSNTDVNTCNDTSGLNDPPSSQHKNINERALPASKLTRPRTKTSKKKRSTQRHACPPHTKHNHPSPASPSCSAKLVSAARRLAQVTAPYVALPASARTCPICGYTPPPNNEERELKRHHIAHFPMADDEARFVCNGVSVDNAARYGVQDADAAVVQGEVRVGRFCLMKFGRRDALLRHVRNPNIACVCDVVPAEVYRRKKLL